MRRQPSEKPMTLYAAISMGVGAMVGAGIFALLGEAGARAGNTVEDMPNPSVTLPRSLYAEGTNREVGHPKCLSESRALKGANIRKKRSPFFLGPK